MNSSIFNSFLDWCIETWLLLLSLELIKWCKLIDFYMFFTSVLCCLDVYKKPHWCLYLLLCELLIGLFSSFCWSLTRWCLHIVCLRENFYCSAYMGMWVARYLIIIAIGLAWSFWCYRIPMFNWLLVVEQEWAASAVDNGLD